MKLTLPRYLIVDELSEGGNHIQLCGYPQGSIEGNIATYVRGLLKAYVFTGSSAQEEILILPRKTKQLPSGFGKIIGFDGGPTDEELNKTDFDCGEASWLRFPINDLSGGDEPRQQALEQIIASWEGAFRFDVADESTHRKGLRGPQIGALHALHAHWAIDDGPATIVLPTGTGKTETMLAILVSELCQKVMIVVPTDSLRTQIATKFLELGLLKDPRVGVLASKARTPFVCTLEHILTTEAQVDKLLSRAQICVTTSHILGRTPESVQARFAHHCPYLFIDEAHHVEAPTWDRFKDKFRNGRIVQFTATPFREDGQLIDGKIIFRYPLRKAQAEGYFRPIRFDAVEIF